MSMFCYQCQETCKNTGCTVRGMCGKQEDTANLQDLLIFAVRGLATAAACKKQAANKEIGRLLTHSLFVTITNANFDNQAITELISKVFAVRNQLRGCCACTGNMPDCVSWNGSEAEYEAKAREIGVLSTENEDIRSLRSLVTYGVKGLGAYAHHAEMLGMEDESIYAFVVEALSALDKDLTADELVALVMKTGEYGVKTMALLDKANTTAYGDPEISEVNIGTRNNPGILISVMI